MIALVRWTGAILLFLLLAMIALPLPAQADDLEFETYSIPVRTVGDDGGHTINELTIRCFRNGCVTQEPGGEGEPITDLQLTETDLQSTGRYKSTWSLDGDRIVSDAVKDFGAAVDELLNLGRKLAKAEEK